jgi:hypothetical protein
MRKVLWLQVLVFLLFIASCRKEYSFEGGNTPTPIDTTRNPSPSVFGLPVCTYCNSNNSNDLWSWSFKMENTIACGKLDTAIVINNRTVFTFFGSSSCSIDTGIVVTVYLQNDTLNRDIPYLYTNKVSFFYYDRATPSYILISQVYSPFSLMLENYNHQTRLATGSFSGTALAPDNHFVNINSGKFKVKLL